MLPSIRVRKTASGSRLWSSWKECQGKEYSEILSLTILPSVLVRKSGNGHGLWNSSKGGFVDECNETLPLTMLPSGLVRKKGNGSTQKRIIRDFDSEDTYKTYFCMTGTYDSISEIAI